MSSNSSTEFKSEGLIRVNNLRLFAYHGVSEIERKVGRHFHVNISVWHPTDKAAIENDLDATVDYARLVEIAKEEMAVTEALLERVTRRIAWAIANEYEQSRRIEVSIQKIRPFLNELIDSTEVNHVLTRD